MSPGTNAAQMCARRVLPHTLATARPKRTETLIARLTLTLALTLTLILTLALALTLTLTLAGQRDPHARGLCSACVETLETGHDGGGGGRGDDQVRHLA